MTISHSIIIPTFNRAALLKKTLLSIIEQQYAGDDFEVIVVDNGSNDHTRAVCREMAGHITHFSYHFNSEPGLLTGRHAGTGFSKGDVLSFIDDDVELSPRWINTVKNIFGSRPDVVIVGGPSLPKYQAYPPVWMQYFRQPTPYGGSMCLPLSLIDIGCTELEVNPLYVFGLNYSIRKQALLTLGGFHPDCIPAHLQQYQGDGETGLSIKAAGKNIQALFVGAAFLYHHVPPDRMTPAYFRTWHYYSGVCNSYTDIRKRNHLYPADQSGSSAANRYVKQVKHTSAQLIRSVIGRGASRRPDEIVRLQLRFNESYQEGYTFHQHAFNTSEAVKTWVLKPDYWDYTLPS